MKDPFATAAKDMILPVLVRLSADHEPDLFFDGDRFMSHLNKTYDHFDIMTYSMTKSRFHVLGRIERLIYGLVQRGTTINANARKLVRNNHIKLFICYVDDPSQPPTIYLGSQNLTHGTNLNIMYKVKPEHTQPLLAFFELVWNS